MVTLRLTRLGTVFAVWDRNGSVIHWETNIEQKGNDMRRRVSFFAIFLTVILAMVPGGTLNRAQSGKGHVRKQWRNWNGVFWEGKQGRKRYMARNGAYYGSQSYGNIVVRVWKISVIGLNEDTTGETV